MFHIVIFEEDPARINRFFAVISANDANIELTVRRTAHEFIDTFMRHRKPDLVVLNSIPCTRSSDSDTGDGRDVACFLADCDSICPVLVHCEDDATATSMLSMLLDGGWPALRFRTWGSDWIETHWYPYVRKLLANT